MNRTDYSSPSRVRNAPMSALTDPGRLHSWDALRVAIGPHVDTVAAVANRSRSLTEKWMRCFGGAYDTGRRNPFHLCHDISVALISEGVPFWTATKPLRWLCLKLGLDVRLRTTLADANPFRVLGDLTLRAGEAGAILARALDPESPGGRGVTAAERQQIEPILDELECAVREYRALLDLEAA